MDEINDDPNFVDTIINREIELYKLTKTTSRVIVVIFLNKTSSVFYR
jgi:hypothetical protein